MITVADILALPAFEQVQAITRCAGRCARGATWASSTVRPTRTTGTGVYPRRVHRDEPGVRATTRAVRALALVLIARRVGIALSCTAPS